MSRWQHTAALTLFQPLSASLLLQQSLQPQLAAQGDQHPPKKRRTTHLSQPGHADSRGAAKHQDPNPNSPAPLTEPWQAACTEIQTFLKGLAPSDSKDVSDADQQFQLQALLLTVLAARKVQSAGLTVALCAVAGKWVKHLLQQQQLQQQQQQQQQGEQRGGLHACCDLIGRCR